MINQSRLSTGESLCSGREWETSSAKQQYLLHGLLWIAARELAMCIPAIDTHCYCLNKHCYTVAFCCYFFPTLLFLVVGEQSCLVVLCKQDKGTWRALSFPLVFVCSRAFLWLAVWQGTNLKGLTQEQEKGLRHPCVISSLRGHSWTTQSMITPFDLSALEPKHR